MYLVQILCYDGTWRTVYTSKAMINSFIAFRAFGKDAKIVGPNGNEIAYHKK